MSKFTYEANGNWIIRMSDSSKHHEQIFYMCGMMINERPISVAQDISVELSWSKTKSDAIGFVDSEGKDIIDSLVKRLDRKYLLVKKL